MDIAKTDLEKNMYKYKEDIEKDNYNFKYHLCIYKYFSLNLFKQYPF